MKYLRFQLPSSIKNCSELFDDNGSFWRIWDFNQNLPLFSNPVHNVNQNIAKRCNKTDRPAPIFYVFFFLSNWSFLFVKTKTVCLKSTSEEKRNKIVGFLTASTNKENENDIFDFLFYFRFLQWIVLVLNLMGW